MTYVLFNTYVMFYFMQGCMPLGGCHVEPVKEAGHPFALHVTSEDMNVSDIIFNAQCLLYLSNLCMRICAA